MSTKTTFRTSSSTTTTPIFTTARTTKITTTSAPKTSTILTATRTTINVTTTSSVATTKPTTSSLYTTAISTNATTSKTINANSTKATQPQTTAVPTDVYSSAYTSTPTNPSATPTTVTAKQPEKTESLNPSLNSMTVSSAQHGLSSQDKLAIGLPVAFVIAIIITVFVGILIWRSRWKRRRSSSSVLKSSVAATLSSVGRAKWPENLYCDGEQGKHVNSKTRDTEMYTSIHLNSNVGQNDNSHYLNTNSFMESAIPDNTHVDLASSDYEEGGIAPQYAYEHDNEPKNTHVYLVLEEEADKNEIASARNAPNFAKNRKRSHDEIYSLASDATFSGNAIPSRAFRNNEIEDEVSGEMSEINQYSQGRIGAASHGPKHNSGVLLGNRSSANIYFELEKDCEDVVNGGIEDTLVEENMNIDEDVKHYSKFEMS